MTIWSWGFSSLAGKWSQSGQMVFTRVLLYFNVTFLTAATPLQCPIYWLVERTWVLSVLSYSLNHLYRCVERQSSVLEAHSLRFPLENIENIKSWINFSKKGCFVEKSLGIAPHQFSPISSLLTRCWLPWKSDDRDKSFARRCRELRACQNCLLMVPARTQRTGKRTQRTRTEDEIRLTPGAPAKSSIVDELWFIENVNNEWQLRQQLQNEAFLFSARATQRHSHDRTIFFCFDVTRTS